MGWRPQVDTLKPVAKEAVRTGTRTIRHLVESDLDAAQVGDLATRLQHVLHRLWECYGGRKRSESVLYRGDAIDMAAANVTEAQLSILTTLIDRGPVRMSDLSTSRRVRAPTISGIIRRLLELDLVTTWRDSTDQRVVYVDTTARGSTVQRKAAAARKQRVADGLTRLNKRDRKTLRRALPILELIAETAHSEQAHESRDMCSQNAPADQYNVNGTQAHAERTGTDGA